MPFLSRRSVEPLTPSFPSKDRVYPQSSYDLSQTLRERARSEASLLRRFSTLFAARRRAPSKSSLSQTSSSTASSSGIGFSPPFPLFTLPRLSSSSTPQSSLEIRRPSGLGRRASLLGSSDSLVDSEGYGMEIQRSKDVAGPPGFASLPNLLCVTPEISPPQRPSYPLVGPPPMRLTASIALSGSVLTAVLESLGRYELATVALVSRGFCSAARYALYHSLDVETIAESSLERLYSVLASQTELAALVVSFHCHSWLSWEFISPDGRNSSIPADDARRALRNMRNLKSLILPSFASILSHTPALTFSLTQLTILDKKITRSQLVTLRGWLSTQQSLESLSFPHLIEYTGTELSVIDDSDPVTDLSQIEGYGPFTTLLPGLKSLRASTEIVSTLCLAVDNPIQHVTLDVHETLFTGLRPSSVIRSLNGVREMRIIFATEVDKRTVEKFLAVAGSMLTEEGKQDAMKSLEVEVSWSEHDAAETLYGIVTSIISRFHGLEKLKLTSPFRSIQAPIPSPVGLPLLGPSSPTTPSSPPSVYTPSPLRSGIIRKEFVACGVEKSYARTWTQFCPSLCDIQFDFSSSTTEADIELCGVWFRRKVPSLSPPRR